MSDKQTTDPRITLANEARRYFCLPLRMSEQAIPDDIADASLCPTCHVLGEEIKELRRQNRALRQALTWCVVNDGETLFDHPKLLKRFRQILALEDQE